MTIRISTALRNFLAAEGSLRKAVENGTIYYYSGTQPASADAAPSGTLLAKFSAAHAALTPEVLATGSITLTGGSSGSINTLTVNGISILDAAVPFDTSLTQTAANLAAEINRHEGALQVTAEAAGAVVTISAPRAAGASVNGWAVAYTATTLIASTSNMAGGVSAVNGLKYEDANSGSLNKLASQAWEASGLANGTVGWFRLVGAVADSLGADSNASQIRIDGSVGTSGANLNLTSTSIATSAIQTISEFALSVPANA